MNTKVIVTGSSGMIGTRLCEKLLENGLDVVGVDIVPNNWNKTVASKTIIADLRDPKAVAKLPKADLLIHLAANARVYDLVLRPDLAFDNTVMTFNCLEFCRNNGIQRFLFASSREVYGNAGKIVYSEDDVNVQNIESPYSSSKIASESLIWSYQKCYDIDFAIMRFSNVYGMYDNSNRLVPIALQFIRDGLPLTVFGKDKALDFTYIDDCVDGIVGLVTHFDTSKNNAYNIAFGKAVSIEYVVHKLLELKKAKNPVSIQSSRTGEVQQFCADIRKAHSKFGFSPKVSIDEGLRKTVLWYDKHFP